MTAAVFHKHVPYLTSRKAGHRISTWVIVGPYHGPWTCQGHVNVLSRSCWGHIKVKVSVASFGICATEINSNQLHDPFVMAPLESVSLHYITLHYITLHHITSHHITSRHIISHHIASHHITSHHITLHNIINYITLHYITHQGHFGSDLTSFQSVRQINGLAVGF